MKKQSKTYVCLLILIIVTVIAIDSYFTLSRLSDLVIGLDIEKDNVEKDIVITEEINHLEILLHDYLNEWRLLLVEGSNSVRFNVRKRNLDRLKGEINSSIYYIQNRIDETDLDNQAVDAFDRSINDMFATYDNALIDKSVLTQKEKRELEYNYRTLDQDVLNLMESLQSFSSNMLIEELDDGIELFYKILNHLRIQTIISFLMLLITVTGIILSYSRALNRVIEEKNQLLISLKASNQALIVEKDFVEDQNLELKREVIMDKMTALYNQTYMKDYLKGLIDKFCEDTPIFSVIFFDVDYFKAINDTYGHRVGDDVLRTVSKLMKDSFRKDDLIGRYGGEEFIVILENCSLENAYHSAENFRLKLQLYSGFEQNIHITVSGGVKSYDGSEYKTFIEKVDLLLYKAKKDGRNRIVKESS